MKIGAAVGCLTHPHYEPPYEEALRTIGRIGFECAELIAYTAEDLKNYYTNARVRELRRILQGEGLQLSEFILYAHTVSGLSDSDEARRNDSLDAFKRGIDVAKALGTDIVNTVSNWPIEVTTSIPYVPQNIHPYVPGFERFNPKHHFDIPENFDANDQWERYIASLEQAVEICEEKGVRFALEGHANVICGSTDAMLRAFDRIPSASFGTNFDVAWQYMQREYPPMSVYKLRERIFHVHLRDTDGLLCYSYPLGMGVIDWNHFIRSLKEVGFSGTLSMELAGLDRPEKYLAESLDYIKRIMHEENVAD